MANSVSTGRKAPDVRANIRPEARVRSTTKALLLFTLAFSLYAGTFLGTVVAPWWPLKLFISLANAFFLSTLFVIGHDACHQSFAPSKLLNSILGRIALLPSWHPFAGWENGHNHIHHAWTNLSGKDFVWAPLSKEAYDQLPGWHRALHRYYRTALGLGAYYFLEIYIGKLLLPGPKIRGNKRLGRFIADDLLLIAFIAAQTVFLIHAPGWFGNDTSALESLFFGQWLPFVVWNWLIGFLIFLHHTHPQVPWFDNQEEWTFFGGQVLGTAHVTFPGPINWVVYNIMEHTAHHVDTRIPLYNLAEAQKSLRDAYSGEIVEHKFTTRSFRYALRVCKLYNYRTHCWTSWDGEPTSSPTIKEPMESVPCTSSTVQ